MLGGLLFDKDILLEDWDLCRRKIRALPLSFGALVCTGDLLLNNNQLGFLPTDFGQLKVGRHLYLSYNRLGSLPADFSQLVVGF